MAAAADLISRHREKYQLSRADRDGTVADQARDDGDAAN
jgi:hypothetical protein